MPPLRSRFARYAVTVGATAIAVALRATVLTSLWGAKLPLITYYPAILASAWLGGFGPGLLATFLSATAAAFLWLSLPRRPDLGDVVGLLTFVAIGWLMSWLVGALRTTQDQLAESVRRLQAQASIRDAAEETHSRLGAIVQSSDDAIISKNLQGQIMSWNAAATRIFGYSEEEAIGRSITIIIPDDRLAEEANVLAAIRRGDSVDHFETIRIRKDATLIPISLTVSPVRNFTGEIIGASKIARDISARKAAEEERTLLLAREHDARREAELANQAKDEFLAMLGHELRNPLSAISNAVYVLERAGKPDDSTASAREVISRQTVHLARLMDDLLDVGRVISGKTRLDMKPLALHEVARRVLETLRESAKLDRHRVTFDGTPVWIHGDGTRVEQIAVNVITNALKFTPAGGSIGIRVLPESRSAVLRVTDSGMGIAPGILPRIFDLFVQGPASPDGGAQGGLGIGLTLVKQLAERHGGSVEAQSPGPGRGTTVTVRFPAITAPPTDAKRAATVTEGSRRILIVEDNRDAREMLRFMLELWHHTVQEAADGPSGIDAALQFKPDIAIVDVGLPGLDGYEVARHLRASGRAPGLRLIALTGYGLPKDAERAREAGFDAHLVKPVRPERLMEVLTLTHRGPDT
ncbi:MAG TPA: PAS domain S-box protein [Terriglobales bacterium]|nr:PAS domain S-box protein [Terriglobales bacterium]